jgi:very-short-patch-repair endonuclease
MAHGAHSNSVGERQGVSPLDALAGRQHGVVSRGQLLELGFSEGAIARRVKSGALRPRFAGVYQVGPLAGPLATEMAAVLAGGPHSILSHRSALSLWRLLPPAPNSNVHLTIVGRPRRMRPGITFHGVRSLTEGEWTTLRGIPITSPLRSLLDGAPALGSRELSKALTAAEQEGLVSASDLESLPERYRGRRGMGLLRAMVGPRSDRAFTRSEAEERCLSLLRDAALPRPFTNVPVGPYELDFFWPDANVAVEVDGWAFHGTRRRFENDRKKDTWLGGRGIHVIRLTWRQITKEPTAAAVRVGQALALAQIRREAQGRG